MDEAMKEAIQFGWPLTKEELFQREIEREDRQRHRFAKAEHDAAVMRKELPSQRWTPTARYVFGSGVIRAAMSLLP